MASIVGLGLVGHAGTVHVRVGGTTLVEAVKQLRQLPKTQDRRILVYSGFHELPETLRLTHEDSGSAEKPLVIEAAPGAKPVISGGKRLPPMTNLKGIWRQKLPAGSRFA